jgi:hypothetical protein
VILIPSLRASFLLDLNDNGSSLWAKREVLNYQVRRLIDMAQTEKQSKRQGKKGKGPTQDERKS